MGEDDDENSADCGKQAKKVHLDVIEEGLAESVVDGVGQRNTEKGIIV